MIVFATPRNSSRGTPRDALDHLGRVAGEVALEHLEDAARVLQREVALQRALEHAGARLLVERLGGVLARAGRRRDLAALVHPARAVVHPRLGVVAAEDAAEVLGVLEVLAHQRGGVRVVLDVLLEVGLGLQHVVDEAAEEGDVRAGPDRQVLVGDRARAAEARVDVDDLRAVLLGLHHLAEPDGMRLRHRVALDDDAVSVLEGLLVVGGAAAPERCPQTGDGGGVSYAGLVLDLHGAHRGERLLDEVVLLVVERRAAEVREPHRAVHAVAVVVDVLPAVLAGGDHALGDHVHRLVELELLPLRPARPAVQHLGQPARLLDELARGRALRAQRPLVDRGARVALDRDELAAARVDDLAAADRAVRADGLRDLQAGGAGAGLLGLPGDGVRPESPVGGAADDGQVTHALEALGATGHDPHPSPSVEWRNARCPPTGLRSRIPDLSGTLAPDRSDLLHTVAAGTAGVVGEAFLRSLARLGGRGDGRRGRLLPGRAARASAATGRACWPRGRTA